MRIIAAGALIAGFSALASSPVYGGNVSSSAAIGAVARIEYPIGAAPLDELLFSGSISVIPDVPETDDCPKPPENHLLLYSSSSTDLFIQVTSSDQATVPFRIMPDGREPAGGADAGGNLLRLEISNQPDNGAGHTRGPVTITLIPTGI